MFGFTDDNAQELRTPDNAGSRVVFGLNAIKVVSFVFNPNGGKNNEANPCIELNYILGGKEKRYRIYDISKVYGSNGLLTEEDPEYEVKYKESATQISAIGIHIAGGLGVSKEVLKNAFSQPIASFTDWAKILTGLVTIDTNAVYHVFLEYPWNENSEGKKYVDLPKNMKGGSFFYKPTPEQEDVKQWNPVLEWDKEGVTMKGLIYMNSKNEIHPFTRNESYMESNKATDENGNLAFRETSTNVTTTSSSNAAKEAW